MDEVPVVIIAGMLHRHYGKTRQEFHQYFPGKRAPNSSCFQREVTQRAMHLN